MKKIPGDLLSFFLCGRTDVTALSGGSHYQMVE